MKLILIFLVSCIFLKTWADYLGCTYPETSCGELGNGVCRTYCFRYEMVCPYTQCDGPNCKSCKPNQKCPDVCPAFYDAVCGSDGKTYSNRCEIKKASCQNHYEDIVFQHKGTCDGGSGPRPDSPCTFSERPCGKNGNGVCRTTCFVNESVSRYSQCDGPNCKCCKPEEVGSSYALFARMTEENNAIRGNLYSITEEHRAITINLLSMTEINKAIKGNLSSMAEDLTLTKTKLEKCKTRTQSIREVDIERSDGSVAGCTSRNRYVFTIAAFDGSGFWMPSTGSVMPQAIWIHFRKRPPVKVLSYAFKSFDSKICKTDAEKTTCRKQGPSKYEFFGSNSTDCTSSRVVLDRDDSGTPFSPDYDYRSGTVENPGYYSCYGFTFLECPGGKTVYVRHVRLYH